MHKLIADKICQDPLRVDLCWEFDCLLGLGVRFPTRCEITIGQMDAEMVITLVNYGALV